MSANMGLVVAGVNFRKTSLEVRNKFALTTEHIKNVYLHPDGGKVKEFVALSTCNRTEIYSTSESPDDLLRLLATHNHISGEDVRQYAFVKTGDDALKHIFRVAAGLDSQILGDYEIIAQLKNAFTLAKSYNRTNGYMEKVINAALQASRQIKSKTSISDGTTSVSYSAMRLIKKEVAEDRSLNICLLGLGKIGTLTLKNLIKYLPQHNIIVVNRNEQKAKGVAEEYKVDYAPYTNQAEVLKASDILIVATGADHPVISKNDIKGSGVKLIFDLSVPSNVDVAVRELEGVKFYDIDQLSQIVNETIEQRSKDLPAAEAIIEEHFEEFRQWETRRVQYRKKEISDKGGQSTNHTNSDESKPAGTLAD